MMHSKYTEPHYLLQFFKYEDLPEKLKKISKSFTELAHIVDIQSADNNPEKEMALRKLLESKDCAVRSLLYLK